MSDEPTGDIAGPGGAYERNAVVIDTRGAVLMDSVDCATMTNPSDGRRAIALKLGGRVNREERRRSQLYLFGPDGAAALVSELMDLVRREGETGGDQSIVDDFWTGLVKRQEALARLRVDRE